MKKILLLSFIVSFFFVQDVFASVGPTLAEVTPVSPNPTSDTTPDYTFSLDEPSALTYGGSCSSELTGTQGGSSVTITFNELPSGTYSDCTIMATGYSSGVDSNVLNVTPFTIKTDNDFLITVKTDNGGASNNNQFTIPVTSGANYNVDCDDSTASYDVMGRSGAYTCTYPSAGTYTIRISDNVGDDTGFQRIEFSGSTDARKLLSVNNWGTLKWSSMQWAFWGCSNFTGISSGAGSPDLSNVTNMSAMFNGASSFNADISSWDVSNVTDMSFMFENANSFFNGNISSWDTSAVTDMAAMFRDVISFRDDIGSWNVANVTNMEDMFNGAVIFNRDIGGWDTSQVTTMKGMFGGCSMFNQDISSWNTSNVTYIDGMFRGARKFNQDIGSWDTSKVTRMYGIFDGATNFNQDISSWDVSGALRMDNVFKNATSFNQDIGSWDVSSVGGQGGMENMFSGVTLSTENYDSLLNGWNALTLQSGVIFDGGNSKYCKGESARSNMISSDSWTITDGGKECPPPPPAPPAPKPTTDPTDDDKDDDKDDDEGEEVDKKTEKKYKEYKKKYKNQKSKKANKEIKSWKKGSVAEFIKYIEYKSIYNKYKDLSKRERKEFLSPEEYEKFELYKKYKGYKEYKKLKDKVK